MERIVSIIYVIDAEEWKTEQQEFLKGVLEGGNAEVFLYDITGNNENKTVIKELENQYKDRLFCRTGEGGNIWQCYNEGMRECSGKYVNFTKSTVHFQPELLSEVCDAFGDYQVSAVALTPFQVMGERRTSCLYYSGRNMVQNVYEKPFHTNMCLESYFIEREKMQGLQFDEKASSATTEFTLLKLLEKIEQYAILEGICEIEEYLFFDGYNYSRLYDKDWYTKEVRDIYLPFLLENRESSVRQAWLLVLMEFKLNGNVNDRNKAVLSENEITEFFDTLSDIFRHMDDNILVQYQWIHKRILPRFMSMNFLRMKYGTVNFPIHMEMDPQTGENRVAVYENVRVERYNKIVLDLLDINDEGDRLIFDGELVNMYFAADEDIRIYLCIGKEKTCVNRIDTYRYTKYFGRPVQKGYMFQAVLPAEKYKGKDVRFHFEVEYQGRTIRPRYGSKNIQSRIRYNVRFSYWAFGDSILRYDKKKKELVIEQASFLRKVRHELLYEMWMMNQWRKEKDAEKRKTLMNSLLLRMAYFLTKPVYGKRNIWVTADQLFKGGDNGEYFFRYMRENHKEIDMYYIINGNTPEYRSLQPKYGHVLKFGSMRGKLMSLHAKLIFDTRANVKLYSGFTENDEYHIRDLFNAEVVCLQHGLTIQKIAQYQNRLFDNLKYYFCVSPYEVENIKQPIYGYTDDMISLTGAPRYDGLTGEPRKQILITPTWRRNVTEGTNKKGQNHAYSVNFRNTNYYQIYNTLINDKKLIACAEKTGYKLIYLIHPILSPQIGDFDTNDYVEIRPGADVNYEEILKESSLMVTDYSGIQFDFAYMRRPLIYYHPDKLPPQYDEGNLKYDTMGFGPVCRTHDEMVAELCRFMENDCRLEDKYRERIEDFFPYSDQNNCKRVYEAAVKFQERVRMNSHRQ